MLNERIAFMGTERNKLHNVIMFPSRDREPIVLVLLYISHILQNHSSMTLMSYCIYGTV